MVNSSTNITVSSILKNKNSFEDESRKRSRKEWLKEKLEEARKASLLQAIIDKESTNINLHISQYISSARWYFVAQTLTS